MATIFKNYQPVTVQVGHATQEFEAEIFFTVDYWGCQQTWNSPAEPATCEILEVRFKNQKGAYVFHDFMPSLMDLAETMIDSDVLLQAATYQIEHDEPERERFFEKG